MVDDLSSVRAEDQFDVAAVHLWLTRYMDDLNQVPIVNQFRSGASNLTYLLTYPDRELVLRTPPRGTKAASAHDMKREVHIQRSLRPQYPLVPEIFALCEETSVIGADFYIMERVKGTILRRDLPPELKLSLDQTVELGQKVVQGLVQLHQIDAQILKEFNKGPGYVSRQIQGWSARYRKALTDDVPTAELLMSWLDANQPPDVGACVIHGDWRLDNMVLDLFGPPKLVGVLDWELATVGDPLMDLGSALAYWIDSSDDPHFSSLRRQPSHLPGMPTRAQFVERYLALANWPCSDFTFYEVFGLFRLAVILQQIWDRYRKGQTTNPAFAGFGSAVHVLINRATELSVSAR